MVVGVVVVVAAVVGGGGDEERRSGRRNSSRSSSKTRIGMMVAFVAIAAATIIGAVAFAVAPLCRDECMVLFMVTMATVLKA